MANLDFLKDKQESKYSFLQAVVLKVMNAVGFLFLGELKSVTSAMVERWNLKKQYKKLGVRFLDVSIEKLTPHFALYIYELFRLLQSFERLFLDAMKSISDLESKNVQIKGMFFAHYINSLLQQSDRKTLEDIQDPGFFRNIVATEAQPKEAFAKHLKQEFETIKTQNSKKLDYYLYYFNKLLVLARFDFQGFFMPFDKQFKASPNYKPVFHSMFGPQAGKHLMSLHTYVSFIDFVAIPSDVLQHFYKELELFNALCKEDPHISEKKLTDAKALVENLVELVKRITFLNENDIFGVMIKFLTGQFDYQAKATSQIPRQTSYLSNTCSFYKYTYKIPFSDHMIKYKSN